MARTYTPKDGYAIMNALCRLATTQANISVVDTSSFVSAGETLLSLPIENVYNAMGILIGRQFMATRPKKAKLAKINAINTDCYTSRLRKISFYSKDALPSGYFNTDLFTNLAEGFTAGENESGGTPQSTKSQWEQHPAYPFSMDFGGSTVWDDCLTYYEKQIRAAFRDPVQLAEFVAGQVTEHANDIEEQKEAFSRMTLLAKIGQTYLYNEGVNWATGGSVNLTAAFNARYGTNYTSAQLRSTYLKDFLAFMVATIKKYSDRLTDRSKKYHLPMTMTKNGVSYSLLRHTPYDKQLLFLYEPLFREAETLVLPEIFHDEKLNLDKQYEGVSFWQFNGTTDEDCAKVQIRVPYLDINTGEQKSSGDLKFDYVVGLLTDVDGQMVDFQMEDAYTTAVEARKGYRNTWLHMSKNSIVDGTENSILFYMQDPPTKDAPADDTPGKGD